MSDSDVVGAQGPIRWQCAKDFLGTDCLSVHSDQKILETRGVDALSIDFRYELLRRHDRHAGDLEILQWIFEAQIHALELVDRFDSKTGRALVEMLPEFVQQSLEGWTVEESE